jgi:hypothetical protein
MPALFHPHPPCSPALPADSLRPPAAAASPPAARRVRPFRHLQAEGGSGKSFFAVASDDPLDLQSIIFEEEARPARAQPKNGRQNAEKQSSVCAVM